MKSFITLLIVLGILSFGFVNESVQSLFAVGTGLFFLGLAAHLNDKYEKKTTWEKSISE